MTSESLPLVLAAVFTLGCIAIRKAGRHAEAVGHALGVVLGIVLALLLMEVLVQAIPQADGISPPADRGIAGPPKLMGRVQVWN